MDDFRVGSVPSSDPYGNRQPSGPVQRKREKHRDDEEGRQEQEAADTFETLPGDNPNSDPGEAIEDYYLPSDPDQPD